MVDVFIAYGPGGRDRVEALAGELNRLLVATSEGSDDLILAANPPVDGVTDAGNAKCVLICWTGAPLQAGSKLEAEVNSAAARSALIPILLEPNITGAPPSMLSAADLTGWSPTAPPTAAWLGVLDAIGRLLGRHGLANFVRAEATGKSEALTVWAEIYPNDPLAPSVSPRIDYPASFAEPDQMVFRAPHSQSFNKNALPRPLDVGTLLSMRAKASTAGNAPGWQPESSPTMAARSVPYGDQASWQSTPSMQAPASPARQSRARPSGGRVAVAIGIAGALLAAAGAAVAVFTAAGTLSPPPAPSPGTVPPVAPPAPRQRTVEASAFAAEGAGPGEEMMVQLLLHNRADREAAAHFASEADPSAGRRGIATLDADIELGERITILLEGRGLEVDEPVQTIVWNDEPVACQFVVTLPDAEDGRLCHIRARVMRGAVPIGSLRFAVKVSDRASSTISIRGESAHRYHRAFLSYASADRAEVLKRAQGLRAVGIDFFQDILSIQPGEDWSRRLEAEIDRCDLFLLFWSQNAAKSEWVLREVERAVQRQSQSPMESPDITPIVLEGPPPPSPIPSSLKHLHFSDYLTYAIAAGVTARQKQS